MADSKWRRHGWIGASGPVGQVDLWQQIGASVVLHGNTLTFRWLPPHVEIEGNGQAGKLAEQGRPKHAYSELHEPKRQCGPQGGAIWQERGSE